MAATREATQPSDTTAARGACRAARAQVFPDLGAEVAVTAGSLLTRLAVGIGAVALAPLLTYRRMRAMDLPATLRVVE